MTPIFWELYLPALAILLGLGILAGIVEARVRSAFRRWRVQQELARFRPLNMPYIERVRLTPKQLEGLATARDKAERKIH